MEMNATTNRERRLAFLGYGACFVAGCLWGTGFYFGRLALNEMSVGHMVLYRFLFACLGMLPVALVHRASFGSPPASCACCYGALFSACPSSFCFSFRDWFAPRSATPR